MASVCLAITAEWECTHAVSLDNREVCAFQRNVPFICPSVRYLSLSFAVNKRPKQSVLAVSRENDGIRLATAEF